MRRRQTVAIVVVLLIVIVIAAIPFVGGILIKDQYLKTLQIVATDSYMHIDVLEYKKGWLSSTAKIHVWKDITYPESVAKNPDVHLPKRLEFTFDQFISHGPLLFDPASQSWTLAMGAVTTRFNFPIFMKSVFVNNQNNKSDFEVDSLILFNDNYKNHISTSTFTLVPFPGMPNIVWEGIQGNVDFQIRDNHVQQTNINYVFNALNLKSPAINMLLQNQTYDGVFTRNSIGLYDGKSSYSLPGLSVSGQMVPAFELKGLSLHQTHMVDAGKFSNFNFDLALNSLITPDITISPANFKFAATHLNALALKTFFTSFQAAVDPDKLIYTIFTPASVVSVSSNINTNAGNFMGNGQFYLPQGLVMPTSTEALAASVNFKVNVKIASSLVKELLLLRFGTPAPVAVEQTIDLSHPTDEMIILQIGVWGKQQKLKVDVVSQLKDLVKLKLTGDLFSKNVDAYVLRKDMPEDIANQLKSAYLILHPAPLPKQIPGHPVAAPVAIVLPPASAPVPQALSPADEFNQKLSNWIQAGYVKVDKDDYVIEITREQGVIKVNGLVATPDTFK